MSYPFKIAFISDTHNDYDELQDFIDYINRNSSEYAFVIHSGDVTSHGTKREYDVFKRIVQKLNRPLFVTIGNHDAFNNGASIFEKLFGNLQT